jgi:predicted AlkP superfamily pyrophosphatase or phosphodiesterase
MPGHLKGVLPDYDGRGISSLVPEIYARLGAPIPGQPRMCEEILSPDVFKGVKRIVLILLDGLGYNTLKRHAKRGKQYLLDEAESFTRLTSVTPSTTSSVLCTLSTGVPPAIHGIVGYRLLLPKEKELVDIIAYKRAYSDQLVQIDPYTQMLAPPAYSMLTEAGVSACVLTRDRYAR